MKKADLISNIRRLLRAHHLKQRDLAEVLGVSEQAVIIRFTLAATISCAFIFACGMLIVAVIVT